MSDRREVAQGVNILVLDGGGVSGLSSLMILDQNMDRLQHLKGLSQPPDIHEEFDIVAGTGTGALGVCMLGRLGIPLKQAIEHYTTLAEVFSDRKLIKTSGPSVFKLRKLTKVLKKIICDVTGSEDAQMTDARPGANKCKTMIFAMSRHNMNAGIPCIFRSYQGVADQMPGCTIWQALCASMAHPDLFKSVEIGEPPMRESFVGGGLVCNNPIAHVLGEAKALYPERHISCVMSIGSGHTHTIKISKPNPLQRIFPTNSVAVMKDIATDSERVAQDMAVRFRHTTNVYFRFNVDQGMQGIRLSDWGQLSKVTAHTRAYMHQEETNERMDRAAEAIRARNPAVSMTQIDGEIQVPRAKKVTGMKTCPVPTAVFTGQKDKIEQVTTCITRGDKERCVFILHGLGGAGKTQIALKTIEKTSDMWTDIIFVDATSRETTTSALEGFAKDKKIGETHNDAIRWLGDHKERWLMLFDNADDPSLGISRFFPQGGHGSILVTTRVPGLALLGRGLKSDCRVSDMVPEEALELLLKAARLEGEVLLEAERNAAVQLLQDFGHLALAAVHAGAYIWCSQCTIHQYRKIFLKQRRETLDKYSSILASVDGYQKSVYTTWHISYEQLSACAQQLLWLMAFLHHDNITEEIFHRAATNTQTYENCIPPSDTEIEAQRYIKHYLQAYLDSTGAWSSGAFLAVMTELMSYSLVTYDRVNAAYTLHVLVHDWASTVVPHPATIGVERTAFLVAVSIGHGKTTDEYSFKGALELHVGRMLERQSQPSANNAALFARLYHHMGKWSRSESLLVQVLDIRKQVLGDVHPDTLLTMAKLAFNYERLGQYERAETLQLQALEFQKQVLGDEHRHTLRSMNNLSLIYHSVGRFYQAETLQTHVLDIQKRVLGNEHPHTLNSMDNLASTYWSLGRFKQAEILQLQALEVHKRLLNDGHPDRLISMNNLALTYHSLRQFKQAETLQLQVLHIHKQTLGDEHPNTLIGMNNLALTYQGQGQFGPAETLQIQVLEARQRLLGNEHPHTLNSMTNLASTYMNLGRSDDAEILQVQVQEARQRALGVEHPDTLNSTGHLAHNYWEQGRFEKAEVLQAQVVDASKRVLGPRHPHTLVAIRNLANTYRSLGRPRQDKLDELLGQIAELEA